eukprot:5119821-Pyramimonas_sp.AAC.1
MGAEGLLGRLCPSCTVQHTLKMPLVSLLGTVRWALRNGGLADDVARAVALSQPPIITWDFTGVVEEEHVYVTGSFERGKFGGTFGVSSMDNAGGRDMFLMKRDMTLSSTISTRTHRPLPCSFNHDVGHVSVKRVCVFLHARAL